MEGHSYVSCIKINGIPILPPMITKDIKRELSNYKESAINIEKKLIISRINKQCNSNTYKVQKELKDIKYNHSSRENLIPFEYDNFNENIVTDISDVPIETFKSSNENLEKNFRV